MKQSYILNKYFLLAIIMVVCSSSALLSQAFGERELPLDLGFIARLNETHHAPITHSGELVEGSPYLTEDWTAASVVDIKDRKHSLEIRYRLTDDIMEVRRDQDHEVYGLVADQVKSLTMDGREYIQFPYFKEADKIGRGYFELIQDGDKISLYRKTSAKFSRGRDIPALNKKIPSKFETSSHYYVKVGDEVISKIELNKKNVLTLMNDSRKVVEKYRKKNKLNLKKLPDVIKILEYYNTVVE